MVTPRPQKIERSLAGGMEFMHYRDSIVPSRTRCRVRANVLCSAAL
jgi:hypothetical protein